MSADAGNKEPTGDCQFPGWEPFLPHLVHPIKVAIVEALLCIGEPLSAVQFGRVLSSAGNGFCESNVRYHLKHLAELGVRELTSGSGGGPREKFFYFTGGEQKRR